MSNIRIRSKLRAFADQWAISHPVFLALRLVEIVSMAQWPTAGDGMEAQIGSYVHGMGQWTS